MAHVNGDVIILKWGSNQVDALITNSINVSANMIETTDKDSGGDSDFIPGNRTWTVDFEGVYDQAGTENAADILADLKSAASSTVYFGGTTAGDTYWSGTGYVSSLNISSPQNDKVSFSGSFQGSGALTPATVSA